jgi:hypothetical protein
MGLFDFLIRKKKLQSAEAEKAQPEAAAPEQAQQDAAVEHAQHQPAAPGQPAGLAAGKPTGPALPPTAKITKSDLVKALAAKPKD